MGDVDAVLFDFDFTLADSSAGILVCVRSALEQMGHGACEEAEVRRCIGLPLPVIYRRLTGEERRAGEFFEAFMARADAVMESMTELYPDAMEAVAGLRGAGIRTGIVSTKVRRRIDSVLAARGRGHLFDVVIGIEDVPAPKPDPAGILIALGRLGVAPGRAMYVGDHAVDAQAAAGAGVRFCGVLTGETPRATFGAMGVRCVGCAADLARELAGGD